MRRWTLFVAGLLCATLHAPAQPPNEHGLRTELIKVRKKLKISQKKLEEANRQEQELADELGITEGLLDEFSERLREIRTELSLAKSRHEVVRRQVTESRDRLKRKRRALGLRLREIELEGSASYLQVLLHARSFTQFLVNGEYLQRVVDSQKKLIAAVKNEREILEQRREAAQRTVNEIRSLEDDFRQKVSDLGKIQDKQAELLARLQFHRKSLEKYVTGLEHISQEMENKLQTIIRTRGTALGPIIPGTGRFIYPVSGPITSPFGYRVHPVTGTTRFHSGLDFGVEYGTPIRCADNGVVIHAEWYGGYGNCVIVQHSNDLSTLYAHQSELLVKQGDTIMQGQPVGRVGSTGMSTGPHLHFEVRQSGTPVDPLGYL
ncbi:peptidoglycan DD-metalloendopeptidase family protein [bacterium]|nr:peptidoglycan DD-metalloendopeptidase family protein [bacterium]